MKRGDDVYNTILKELSQDAYLDGAEHIRRMFNVVVTDDEGNETTWRDLVLIGIMKAAASGNASAFKALWLAAYGNWPETINYNKNKERVIDQARNAGLLDNPMIRALIYGVDGDTITSEPARHIGASGTPETGGTTDTGESGEADESQPAVQDIPEDVSG